MEAAAAEEALTDFDPSGSSGIAANGSQDKHSTDAESSPDTWATQTTSTEASGLSNDFSNLSVGGRKDGSADGGYYKETEQFDVPTKELLLAETFPKLRLELVRYTLKKCNDDFNKATDELLNHTFFEGAKSSPTEQIPSTKSVDAFSEDHHVPHRGSKKGKGKRKQQRVSLNSIDYTDSSGSEALGPVANPWQNATRDVDFITSRTNLPSNTVTSLYHTHSASLSATLLSIVRKDIARHKSSADQDPALIQDAITLNASFPSLDLDHALSLVRLTAPSITHATALAQALSAQPASETGGKGGIKLDLRYAPINLSDPVEPSTAPALPVLAPSARPRDLASTSRARSEAFQNASAAYRKGRSTPLMKAAAGYYAQEGRDLSMHITSLRGAEADAFVSQQSGADFLDLHGVTVADATRIAKQRTQVWWDSLGERRIPEWSGAGKRGGGERFRIITGLGRHSEGGRGKLGPAVMKVLVDGGWKVEVEPGELCVTGQSKRR